MWSRARWRVNLAARALRSGLRRYPAELARALAGVSPGEAAARLAPRLPEGAGLSASWLGHASVLMRVGGATVLTDPVFSHRVGPRIAGRTLGLARTDAVGGVEVGRPDVILVSHAHFDHLDRPTLARLADERTTVVTPVRVRRLIPRGFARVIEVEPGGVVEVAGLEVRAVRPRHWGARAGLDRRRGYSAYVISGGGHRVLFGGDTADTDAFDALASAGEGWGGGVSLAVMGIGAYDPWAHAHANPEEVWRMCGRMGARFVLPVHHSTFPLGDEPEGEPMARLLAAAGDDAGRVIRVSPGEVWVGPGEWAR